MIDPKNLQLLTQYGSMWIITSHICTLSLWTFVVWFETAEVVNQLSGLSAKWQFVLVVVTNKGPFFKP